MDAIVENDIMDAVETMQEDPSLSIVYKNLFGQFDNPHIKTTKVLVFITRIGLIENQDQYVKFLKELGKKKASMKKPNEKLLKELFEEKLDLEGLLEKLNKEEPLKKLLEKVEIVEILRKLAIVELGKKKALKIHGEEKLLKELGIVEVDKEELFKKLGKKQLLKILLEKLDDEEPNKKYVKLYTEGIHHYWGIYQLNKTIKIPDGLDEKKKQAKKEISNFIGQAESVSEL